MKKVLSLLLLFPLTTIAAEHGGKAMQKKGQSQQASEHGGKAMEKKEHGGKAMEMKEQSGKATEHAGTAAEEDRQPVQKEASENADAPVE